MKKILVTGACGQVGSELVPALRTKYGNDAVIATGHKTEPSQELLDGGEFHYIDCTEIKCIAEIVEKYDIGTIYNLTTILSAKAEANPQLAWDVNVNSLRNILEVAREYKCAVFTPSTIGAFGPDTPLDNTPQITVQRPNTMYGITKVAGELLCDYYYRKYGVDTRGVRWPGLISYVTPPGGGTTDYAVEIFYEAVKHGKYLHCFIREGTYLDMMYMPDALESAIMIMEADSRRLKHRNAYNVTAMSFAPEHIAREIKKHIPGFTIEYRVDPVRQAIAESWPNKMDDSAARTDWGWTPKYDLASMTTDMINKLSARFKK
ncbi:MAG TPA: L-threonine 3-dehydrogenase [Dehalococcoidia bacterium]|nr:L-threonine 3-dehydrogenase [Dehalococcoidia bacterium]